jgi:predicted ATPase
MASDPNGGVCLIRRVVIRNYKSIAACDVELGPLTFLVGPNGSGKSNFLDALRFVSDSLRYSLEHALRDRGGIDEVRRRSAGENENIAIRLEFRLPGDAEGHYAFEIGGSRNNAVILHEECVIGGGLLLTGPRPHFFEVGDGHVRRSFHDFGPARVKDRLYLVSLSGTPAFRPVYDALANMGFYNLNPDVIRDLQPPDTGEILARDGANLPGVLQRLSSRNPRLKARVEEYLAQVVPDIRGVDALALGPRETVEFLQQDARGEEPLRFLAANMSDGTLRALGVLLALFQGGMDDATGPLLVGIEEPETALHPAAAEVLVDSLHDASDLRQILVTSHSPDLLDNSSIAGDILVVLAEEGESKIGSLDEVGRSVLRDHLYTAGDLLRMDQLRPSPAAMTLKPDQLTLFGMAAETAET